MSRYLLARGVDVFDVNRIDRADRRRRGKPDPLDAQNAARAVLSGRARARAKAGDGPVQIARMYKLAKASAVKARTQAINQLKSVLVTADPVLRAELAPLGSVELVRLCARLPGSVVDGEGGEEMVLQATRITLGLLACRIGQLSEQIEDVEARMARLVACHAPQLLEVVGIGPNTAVALLFAVGDNPERLESEGSFAALCGVSPVERSSGRRQFRRLNRGGDRQANAALHRIVSPACALMRVRRVLRAPAEGGQAPAGGHPLPQTLRGPGGLPLGPAAAAQPSLLRCRFEGDGKQIALLAA
ncbi:transposase [Streptomyces sp. NPDC006552]|uniref:transposase n=1 Tax=Streptomyces sp. NPDC006552 TaxID=3157179 RepID=UPI0033A56E6A